MVAFARGQHIKSVSALRKSLEQEVTKHGGESPGALAAAATLAHAYMAVADYAGAHTIVSKAWQSARSLAANNWVHVVVFRTYSMVLARMGNTRLLEVVQADAESRGMDATSV